MVGTPPKASGSSLPLLSNSKLKYPGIEEDSDLSLLSDLSLDPTTGDDGVMGTLSLALSASRSARCCSCCTFSTAMRLSISSISFPFFLIPGRTPLYQNRDNTAV